MVFSNQDLIDVESSSFSNTGSMSVPADQQQQQQQSNSHRLFSPVIPTLENILNRPFQLSQVSTTTAPVGASSSTSYRESNTRSRTIVSPLLGEQEDKENQPPQYDIQYELLEAPNLDRDGPFSEIDMKKLIQECIKIWEPSVMERLLKLLPDPDTAFKIGFEFFDDSNTVFWTAVLQWENTLINGGFENINTFTNVTSSIIPFKDESYLRYWERRVKRNIRHIKRRRSSSAEKLDDEEKLGSIGKSRSARKTKR